MMKLDDLFFREVLDNLYEGVYFVDRDHTILYWNKGAERLTGYSSTEVMGVPCWNQLLMHVDTNGSGLCLNGCPLHKSMKDGVQSEDDLYLRHKNGHRVPVRMRILPVRSDDGNVIGAIEILIDNSEKMHSLETIEDLQRKVFLDPLTGLANRRYINTGLPARFDEMSRYGWQFGVIM